ncbi:MAG: SpoIVB peptidase [Clostridiales bacterium]|nr:SpoIVB peptidase [Clostridiales bacterium]MDD7310245.1 SpoIVB peptidase [Eubacteriales bacterium]MDY5347110.1 SpoIVB peptidase [Eubacteriales bacterium]
MRIKHARRLSRRLAGAAIAVLAVFTLVTAEGEAAASPVSCRPVRLEADYLVPVGRTVGIKIRSGGVIITALSTVETTDGTACPAKEAGLQPGDIITRIDGAAVKTAEALVSAVNRRSGAVELTVQRGEKTVQCRLTPAKDRSGGQRKIGAFVRDSLAGIGTITFYDPQSGVFGALGHGISESETGMRMPLETGTLISSTITGVRRGKRGEPGELVGCFDLAKDAGQLYSNLDTGLFGMLSRRELYPELLSAEPVPVGHEGDVRPGRAEILANVSGTAVQRYEIEIVRVLSTERETKNLYLRVTDPALLAATGGIVQGMSGSPILQDGKLIGAVTHVLVSDPAYGYGILIDHMLHTAGAEAQPDAA